MLVPSSAWEERILASIDKGIDAFGPSVKNVLYYRFTSIYNSKRQEILRKPELFTESLRTFFGERSFHVEDAIVASLIDTFHLTDVTYADSLTRAIHEAVKQNRN
jgi:hypothetical protein